MQTKFFLFFFLLEFIFKEWWAFKKKSEFRSLILLFKRQQNKHSTNRKSCISNLTHKKWIKSNVSFVKFFDLFSPYCDPLVNIVLCSTSWMRRLATLEVSSQRFRLWDSERNNCSPRLTWVKYTKEIRRVVVDVWRSSQRRYRPLSGQIN